MAVYTWAQLKEYTSVPAVSGWTEDKCLLYQSTAETILGALDLDDTVTGYAEAYNKATLLLFDWLAENPTSLKSLGRGKESKTFADALPANVRLVLQKAMAGDSGPLMGAQLVRKDIGLH